MSFKNSKKQGDFGLGQAIAYFTSIGYTVSLPLTDSQDYDLIVDEGIRLNRVQVKMTTYKTKSGGYGVNLSVKGGNRSYNTIKKFDHAKVDSLFVLTAEDEMYWIPTMNFVAAGNLVVGKKYEMYKVKMGGNPDGAL